MRVLHRLGISLVLGAACSFMAIEYASSKDIRSGTVNPHINPGIGDCDDQARFTVLERETEVLRFEPLILRGCPTNADRYYQAVSADLDLTLTTGPSAVTLDKILDFLGYDALSANQLEIAPPDLLMPADDSAFEQLAALAEEPASFLTAFEPPDFQDNRVVAVRYFAPKVADYERQHPLPGWRKLVRLLAREKSSAHNKGIRAGWILFNEVGGPGSFTNTTFGFNLVYPVTSGPNKTPAHLLKFAYADAIQVILEVEPKELQADANRPNMYFLSFFGRYPAEALGEVPYGLAQYLKASFDVAAAYKDHKGRYFVPGACVQCHSADPVKGATLSEEALASIIKGSKARGLMLNYLDTDQWKAARDSGDFTQLDTVDIPLLIDSDPAVDQEGYEQVFDRFRTLNSEVLAQNLLVGPYRTATRSVQLWIDNHKTSSAYVDRWQRILPSLSAGRLPWTQQNPFDEAVLPLLERYCSRCHMTMFFGIYDRPLVRTKARSAVERIRAAEVGSIAEPYKWMPQGRVLDKPPTRDDMRRLVCYLEALTQTDNPQVPVCPTTAN